MFLFKSFKASGSGSSGIESGDPMSTSGSASAANSSTNTNSSADGPYKEKMEELREQLMKSAQIGQGLLAENQELKSRSKEDTEQVRSINYTIDYLVTRSNLFYPFLFQLAALRQQVGKLEDINRRILAESAEELNLAQKQNVTEIDQLKKTVVEQRQELIDTRAERNRLRDDLDDEKRASEELKAEYAKRIEQKEEQLNQMTQRPTVSTEAYDNEIQVKAYKL